jgi:hypothetical protein
LRYEEAAALIARFGTVDGVVRHIVSEMLENPDSERDWRSLAAVCHEMLTTTVQ